MSEEDTYAGSTIYGGTAHLMHMLPVNGVKTFTFAQCSVPCLLQVKNVTDINLDQQHVNFYHSACYYCVIKYSEIIDTVL